MTTLIACDGSSLKTADGKVGGAIGWAWARDDGAWMSHAHWRGTNQRAELLAILMVLLLNPKGDLTVQMDSQYALNVTEKWAYGWARNNWKKAGGKEPVMNRDIIEPILELRRARQDPITFQWVKGHRRDNAYPLNTAADLHAGEGSQRGRTAKDDFDSFTLYRDSKGRTSLPLVDQMMGRVIASPYSPYR